MKASLRREVGESLRLTGPVVVSQLAIMSMAVVDTLFIGRQGAVATAAVALGNAYTLSIFLVGMGMLMALDPLTSRAVGAGRAGEAWLALQRGAVLAALVSVPTMLLFFAARPVLLCVGEPEAVVEAATGFVYAQVPAVLPLLLFLAMRQYLQGCGVVRPAMTIVVAANVINALANYLFVYGAFGLPSYGPVGSGIATSVSRIFQCLALGVVVVGRAREEGNTLAFTREVLAPGKLKALLKLGFPISIQLGLQSWVLSLTLVMVGWLGAVSLATHQIAMTLANLVCMVPIGIASATSVRMGHALGREDISGVKRAAGIGLAMVGLSSAMTAITFVALTDDWMSLFTPDRAVMALGTTLLPLAGAYQLTSGVVLVAVGSLRGIGDTRAPMWASLIGSWVIGIPLSYLLAFVWGRGVVGLWWGLTLGSGVAGTLLGARLWRRVWC